MDLSPEGVRFISKAALFVVLLLAAAFARTVVGPNPKRHFRMLLGTLGGMALGVALSVPLSKLFDSDVSALSSVAGVLVGWAVAYQFAKQIPRYAK